MKKLAHISDLHVGRKQFDKSLKQLVISLIDNHIDHVVLTGDITDSGKKKEWAAFNNIFAPLLKQDKITLIPGNHDRLGDNVAKNIMNERVLIEEHKGLYIIKVDSTGPHNKWLLFGHGIICDRVLSAIDEAIARAPKDKLIVIALHHHPIPLPEEGFWERMANKINWPAPKELYLGQRLIEIIKGRVDICAHGHRHIPFELTFPSTRSSSIYNAGCTPQLKQYRVFAHRDGEQIKDVKWIHY